MEVATTGIVIHRLILHCLASEFVVDVVVVATMGDSSVVFSYFQH